MSKIIVPKELQQQIVDLYNQGATRKDLISQLNLTFGDSVVKRILEENGVEIRSNPGAKKGGRKKQLVDREIQDKIIDLYVNQEYGLDRIVKELNLPFSFDKVRTILQDNNIHIRNIQESHQKTDTTIYGSRKYSINDDYNLVSHNGAWLLGFLAADGYLPKTKGATNRVIITLAAVDKEILERIKAELQYTGPIVEHESSVLKETGKSYPMVTLAFTSQKIRKGIESFGIKNAKTFDLHHLPNLPEEYMFDFIRGYIDGDGSIYSRGRGISELNLSATGASVEFMTEMFWYIKDNLSLKYEGTFGADHNNVAFRFGKHDSNIICAKLYDNNYLALQRKKDKFNSLRE